MMTNRFKNNPTLIPIVFFFILAITSISAILLYTHSQFTLYQKQAFIRLGNDEHRASSTINAFFIRNITIFKTIAALPEIIEHDTGRANKLFQHLNKAYPQIANAAAVQKDGYFFASGKPFDINNPPSISHVPFFNTISNGATLVIMDPHIGPISKRKVTGIALPILDDSGNFNGLFGGSIYFEELIQLFRVIEAESSTDLLVIDRKNIIQLASVSLSHLVEKELPNESRFNPFSQSEIQNVTLDGGEYIAIATLLPDSNLLVAALSPKPTLGLFLGESPELIFIYLLFLIFFCITGFQLNKGYTLLQKISSHEEQLRAIYNAADSVALITTDVQGEQSRILSFSRGAEIIFGYRAEEIIGCPIKQLHRPGDAVHFPMMQQNGSKGYSDEAILLRKSGEEFPAIYHVHPLYDNQNNLSGTLGVTIDISREKQRETEQKGLEAQLRQSQKMETIGTLAGGIAHDFNNILSAIIGYADIALLELPKDSSSLRDIQQVKKAGYRAKELIQQLLTFSRITPQEKTPILIQNILNEALKLIRATVPVSIKISTDIDSSCPMVVADPTQIHQVFMNLCTNGAQSIEDDQGAINIGLKCVFINDEKFAAIADLQPGMFAKVSICDTGAGIPKEIRERIFEPYYTTKEVGKGSGLGLAVVHGIIQNHGGFIEIEDNNPQGTCFTVFLPTTNIDAPIQNGAPVEETAITGGNERILIVDDETAILDMHTKLLGKLGYKVVSTTESLTALSLFSKTPEEFDIVITDQTMPNLTGENLAKEMLSIRQDIPIIICTGYSKLLNDQTIENLGVYSLLLKPIHHSVLAGTIRDALDSRK